MKINIFWSTIGSRFGEPGGTPPKNSHKIAFPPARMRPPVVNEHFENNRFVSQSNTVSKNSLVSDHYLNFLTTATTFSSRNLTFFCFLFPVSDHPVWPPGTIVGKPSHECHKSSVFDSADQAC